MYILGTIKLRAAIAEHGGVSVVVPQRNHEEILDCEYTLED